MAIDKIGGQIEDGEPIVSEITLDVPGKYMFQAGSTMTAKTHLTVVSEGECFTVLPRQNYSFLESEFGVLVRDGDIVEFDLISSSEDSVNISSISTYNPVLRQADDVGSIVNEVLEG